MIKDFEFYHGAVFARFLNKLDGDIKIKDYHSPSNSSYVINDDIGVYIKYSTKRMSPWRFTFQKEHQDEIENMSESLRSVFIILVCYDDGVVCLSFGELKQALDEVHKKTEWISVSRRKREKYEVKGTDGQLRLKIGEIDFPSKIIKDFNGKKKSRLFSVFSKK